MKLLQVLLVSFSLKALNFNIIVSNFEGCAKIGKDIIEIDKGNGFDAAIGVMLCEGVAKPQDMGLGGGFFGLVQIKKKVPFVINARERCPSNINETSYTHAYSNKIFGKTVGVPSAPAGYNYLHTQYGKTKWTKIVSRVEKMCRNGFPVVIGDVLNKFQYEWIEETHRNIFINKKTQMPYQNGETWKRPDLEKTMKAYKTPNFFSEKKQKLAIIQEINSYGGNIVLKDFDIKPEILDPLTSFFTFGKNSYKVFTTPLPAGGPSLVFILRIMESFYKSHPNHSITNRYYVLIEAMKFAFSFRTEFGDPAVVPMDKILSKMEASVESTLETILERNKTSLISEHYFQKNSLHPDHGTANIIVKTKDELLVLTSTINLRFGSWIVSDKFGFIYNNQLSDFSVPNREGAGHLLPAKNNYPRPGKFPISSISASIIEKFNPKNKKYETFAALGAAGGPKIITSVAQVLVKLFFDGINIKEAISSPRVHNQLEPPTLDIDSGFFKDVSKSFLDQYGYKGNYIIPKINDYSAVTGIQVLDNSTVIGSFDPRRPGGVTSF